MELHTVPSVFDELEKTKPQYEYATNSQRFANFLIDSFACLIFNFFMSSIIDIILLFTVKDIDLRRLFASDIYVSNLINLIGFVLLYTLMEGASKGRTLGKIITKTRVINYDLEPITWKDAFMRSIIRFVPFEPLSIYFGDAIWHDKWSKTYVVRIPEQKRA